MAAGTTSSSAGSPEAGEPLDLMRSFEHHDPQQLLFQFSEIFGARTYLQHGIEVGEGDLVLDAGANVGVAAAFFATVCGAGTVHSFEPVRPLFELLRANVSSLEACVVHDYGLAAVSGPAEITYYPNAAAMSGLYAKPGRDREQVRGSLRSLGVPEEEVRVRLAGTFEPTTLSCELRTVSSVIDEHSIPAVDLLKIDVERAELDVVAGIEPRHWPLIHQVAAEVHDEAGLALREILAERGFEVAIDQERAMAETPIRMLYATRA